MRQADFFGGLMTLTPNDFWNQDNAHRDQKFYTAFCILQSALSDYSLGCDLRDRNCLNWSVTAYYYSMVHATRLICFLAIGDFPTSHQKLASLFFQSRPVTTSWLRYFDGIAGVNVSRSNISNYYSNSTLSADPSLERIGNILKLSCKCRNDSNYEMLLMAHEVNHKFVSPSFKKITKSLNSHSESIFPIAVDAFKVFIDVNDQRSDYWYSYLNWHKENEGLGHIKRFIEYRLLDNMKSDVSFSDRLQLTTSIIRKIDHWIQPLKIHSINDDHANEVYGNIKYGTFLCKQRLMTRFSSAVHELEQI
jgi:hypothetical protein